MREKPAAELTRHDCAPGPCIGNEIITHDRGRIVVVVVCFLHSPPTAVMVDTYVFYNRCYYSYNGFKSYTKPS